MQTSSFLFLFQFPRGLICSIQTESTYLNESVRQYIQQIKE